MFEIPLLIALLSAEPPIVLIDRDNIAITQSCKVQIAAGPIIDADNNGVVHIKGDGLVIDFDSQHLHGANTEQLPDSYSGTGISLGGENITLKNAKISGYKVGIHATKANGLTIHDCDVSNNFHQRLKSTPRGEDESDWLWPHANDNNEWITQYGAGVCVEDSERVTLHAIRARKTQNGIILDRVNDSKVYNCDCSFLSGWGLALWRSNKNVISRNAFDFCVRGYSHGVYNRGQDSAGILMFEQCCDNVIAENSASHCGDGFFGFAGKEALGEVNPRALEWYNRRGCNGNIITSNDFSFAAAHGLELTFSFFNEIWSNQFVGNAICGIWSGYSGETVIARNTFRNNGEMAYGAERGGINIEHGSDNWIFQNDFSQNKCGVHLWWDDDRVLNETLWARANGTASTENVIELNTFDKDTIAVQLRQCDLTDVRANTMNATKTDIDSDVASRQGLAETSLPLPADSRPKAPTSDSIAGNHRPVAARQHLAGRENIIMTEWGPWDHESPLLQFVRRIEGADEYALRGVKTMPKVEDIKTEGAVFAEVDGDKIRVYRDEVETLLPYRIWFQIDGQALEASGLLTGTIWTVKTFPSSVDPRNDYEKWRREGETNPHIITLDALDLPFGSGGMSELHKLPAVLPRDHFGTIATTGMLFLPGTWRITTTSDDGVRVWLNQQLVIDDWTWHAPKKHTHEFTLAEAKPIDIRVEHFELDGHAVLKLDIESVSDTVP